MRLLHHLLGGLRTRRNTAAAKLLRLGDVRVLKRSADDKPDRRIWIDLAHRRKRLLVEAGERIRPRLHQHLGHVIQSAAVVLENVWRIEVARARLHLNLHEDVLSPAHGHQHFRKRRHLLGRLLEAKLAEIRESRVLNNSLSVGCTLQALVMHHNEHAVLSVAHVELKTLYPARKAHLETAKRIVVVFGAPAAMGLYERARASLQLSVRRIPR